jgi:protein TonB
MQEVTMLAYAPRPDRQRLRPATLALIIAGHAAALVAVMSARTAIERRIDPPIVIDTIPLPKPPDPVEPPPPGPARPTPSTLDNPTVLLPLPKPGPAVDAFPQPMPQPGDAIGPEPAPMPLPLDPPIVHKGPRLATSDAALRPPYPDSKRQSGEEASLRLRLSIDEHGRVVAVDAVGRADPTFLAAARRHILRAWRYQPAMEGAKPIPSTTTITLKFELGNG